MGYIKNPKDSCSKTTIIGLPPAGGWTTSKKIIKNIPTPTAIGINKYSGIEKYLSIKIPAKVVTKWPKKTFLGWAKGFSGNPKTRTIVAPNDPANNHPKSVFKVKNDKTPIVTNAKKPVVLAV